MDKIYYEEDKISILFDKWNYLNEKKIDHERMLKNIKSILNTLEVLIVLNINERSDSLESDHKKIYKKIKERVVKKHVKIKDKRTFLKCPDV